MILKQNRKSDWSASTLIVDVRRFTVWWATDFSSCTPPWWWEESQRLNNPDPSSELFLWPESWPLEPYKTYQAWWKNPVGIKNRINFKHSIHKLIFHIITHWRFAALFTIIIKHSSAIKNKKSSFPVTSQARGSFWQITLSDSLNLKVCFLF
jgi:hypothetical protein